MKNFILENTITVYSVLALIIFILSTYLGYLYKRGKRERALLRLELRRSQEKESERQEFFEESIRIISLAAIQKQCEISEAVLRLKKLLESFPEYTNHEKLIPLQNMYEEIKNFSVLGARKDLSKQERFNEDKSRFKVESRYQEDLGEVFEFLYGEFKGQTHENKAEK